MAEKENTQYNFEHPKNLTNFMTLMDTRKLVTTPIFFRIEDDALPPKESLPKLLKLLKSDQKAGIATAASTYRSPSITPQGIGVHMEVERNDVRCIRKLTFPPGLSGVYEAVSCGFFCMAYRYDAFLEGFRNIETGKEFVAVIGCDVPFNNNIFLAGWKILADFGLWCGHMQEVGARSPSGYHVFTKKDAIQSEYVFNPANSFYSYKDVRPNKIPRRRL
jgi:hypothetical protein